MAQFTVYSSSDAGAGNPGLLVGTAGDLLRVLDLVLVNGWTGKVAAGWSKPVANSGNIGCYKNASTANGGNGFGLVINDNGPNVTSTTKEAWATGWESVAGVGAPVGSGSGQFPTPAQLLTSGHVVVRKSADTSTGRAWVCFADSLTFYFFVLSGDVAGAYQTLFFGDFFSLAGSGDAYRGFVYGRGSENIGTANTVTAHSDCLANGSGTTANLGLYVPRSSTGGGTSIIGLPTGAVGCSITTTSTNPGPNIGTMQAPNSVDNAYYTPPIWLMQITGEILRGRFRGLYHTMHPLASFSDGQVITGAGDLSGKTLQVIKQGINGGLWLVETSNTLETN
jgi:hypothetical protein